jgi:hypothetical protein
LDKVSISDLQAASRREAEKGQQKHIQTGRQPHSAFKSQESLLQLSFALSLAYRTQHKVVKPCVPRK